MEIVLVHILAITFLIILLKVLRMNSKHILRIYSFLMFWTSGLILWLGIDRGNSYINKLKIYLVLLVIIISIIIYILDFMCINAVRQNVLILDMAYYFKGNVDKLKFLISILIAVMEELVFRAWITEGPLISYLALIISSLCFGAVHIFFSRYDMVSKAILGLILGGTYIYTNNIVYPIIMHIIYNYLAVKEKGVQPYEQTNTM